MWIRLRAWLTGLFPQYRQDVLLLVIDLIGTFVFAVEGALAGINAGLDVFGLMVLAFVTALGGGTIRDLLIGAVPPNSIRDWRYGATAFAGGGAVFCFHGLIQDVPAHLLITLDAAGLALFAVAGADKALEFGITPLLAVMMGVVTGAGGGTVRDVLLAKVPAVLNSDVYAAAALVGAVVMLGALRVKMPRGLAMSLGAAACFVVRMLAVWQHWNLPKVMR
ncbi:membrane protein [Edaphobacter acidisoli]|uniref:Membrane protein n=1 Tax=Edaphobacter acidisoli TaxID=2040573 RepID=A0A916RHL7_9BACT|nr:TRIC cation channel family protein [Edaphobacter acidisoli]GGA57458.1 membrane protein [Edaphobacter acidisoli]